MEFYDFFIFSTAAVLVFNTVFYASLGPAAAVFISLATVGVAFVARPFGSIIFGHFGDRVGRKKTLVVSMLLMGSATVAVGLLPTPEIIGAAAPILLVVLRVLQGLAVGGEWAGALLLATEYAPEGKRGRYAMFPQLGPSLGLALATSTFLLTGLLMSDEAFLAWGWRIPFLLSAVLVAVGMWVRLSLDETPSFKKVTQKSRIPFFEVVTQQPRQLLLAAGSTIGLLAFFGLSATMLLNYGSTNLGLPRPLVLVAGIIGALVFAATTILGGIWSDRVGRRPILVISSVAAVVVALILFPILDAGTMVMYTLGISLAFAVTGFAYAPLGAQLAEVFATRYRYTGAGVAYNLGSIVGAAVGPLIAASLLENSGSYAIGVMLAVYAAISLVCVIALGETGGLRLDRQTGRDG